MASEAVRSNRRHKPPATEKRVGDPRDEAQRDCDRILNYSKYFHRLAGKSQIISPIATRELMHDRKTHTEKVAQMAEALARHLLHNETYGRRADHGSGLDPLVARAAAGAHDLGHPPFGHVGELELDEIGQAHGLAEGFQANAQSYRIVCKLDVHPGVERGLDLTYAVQHALLKYPWVAGHKFDDGSGQQPETTRYWGLYGSEFRDFSEGEAAGIREGLEPWERTLEAAVMDIADDMTFALHDFEDFFAVGELNVAELLANGFWADEAATMERLEWRYPAEFDARYWSRAGKAVRDYLKLDSMGPLHGPSVDSREQETAIREFTSHWLTRWLAGTFISEEGRLVVSPAAWHEINVLKQVTWERVIVRPTLRISQEGDRRVLRELVAMLYDAYVGNPGQVPSRLLNLVALNQSDPDWTEDKTEETVLVRSVLDYVSWLTEAQARELFSIYSGHAQPSYGRTWVK